MLHILTCDDLKELLQVEADHFVSMFMPTHRSGSERRQDPIRLKNLLTRSEKELVAQGLSEEDAKHLLKPAEAVGTDEPFWRDVSNGLALYCAEEFSRCYRLPLELAEDVKVNQQQFYVKPLLPLLHNDGRFYVLALSLDQAKLYHATRRSIEEITLPDIPRWPSDDDGTDESLQYHSHRAPSAGKGETAEAIYHGQGGQDDRTKENAAKFFRAVNTTLRSVLANESAPLVLACVGYLAPIYAAENSYSNLIREKVPGSPDKWALDELRDRAWQFVEPIFRERQTAAVERWNNAYKGELASDNLQVLLTASRNGRVDSLFVTNDQECFGQIDRDDGSVRTASDDEADRVELLNYIAAQTLVHGGEVFSLSSDSMPTEGSPIAALFRYPTA